MLSWICEGKDLSLRFLFVLDLSKSEDWNRIESGSVIFKYIRTPIIVIERSSSICDNLL